MSKLLFAITVCFILVNQIFTQSEDELKEIFYIAEDHFFLKEYEQAIPYYLKLNELYPENANFKYRLGVSYLLLKKI